MGQIKNVLLHLLLQKRREAQAASGILDEAAQELLEANMEERVKLEAEIEEMRKKSVSNNLYRNLRRSRGSLRSCGVRSCGVRSVDSIHSLRFGQLLRCAHKRIVNVMKVYMERKNVQLELIWFRKKDRIYSRLLFRTDEVNATRVFTLG